MCIPDNWKRILRTGTLYAHVHSGLLHSRAERQKRPKLLGKMWCLHTLGSCSAVRRKETLAAATDTDEPWRPAEGNQPDIKAQILCDSADRRYRMVGPQLQAGERGLPGAGSRRERGPLFSGYGGDAVSEPDSRGSCTILH